MSQENVETLRLVYEAASRQDWNAAFAGWIPTLNGRPFVPEPTMATRK